MTNKGPTKELREILEEMGTSSAFSNKKNPLYKDFFELLSLMEARQKVKHAKAIIADETIKIEAQNKTGQEQKEYFQWPYPAAPAVGRGNKRRPRSKIVRPPGFGLLRFSEIIFSKKFREAILEPTITDMQVEHLEALSNGRVYFARWVMIRGYLSYGNALLASVPAAIAKRIWEAWRAS
nr:hypothetical protein [uncultured Hyphomonas sp.]